MYIYFIVLLKCANVPCSDIINFHCTTIRPVLEYCVPVFHYAFPQYLSEDIERVQKRILCIICPQVWYSECLVRFSLATLHARCMALCLKLFNSITSYPGHKLLPLKRNFRCNIRCPRTYASPHTNTNLFKNSFIPSMCS